MDDPHKAETPDGTPEARFGAELRRLRVQAELTARQLAEDLHRARSTISDFENGKRLPSVEVVEQYEDRFGLQRGTLVVQRERARAQRLGSPRDATLDEHLGDVACPYKGLRAFEYDDATLFFGREPQVEGVLARLAEARFVAVVGASGSGKSSFVRAGLLAGIAAATPNGAACERVALLTPGEHPVDELARAVSAGTGDGARVLADDLRADPDQLERATRGAGDAGLVIVVDQFEELFTLCREEAERRCFVDALIAAWRDPASPVVVIVALRADFYGRVAAYPNLAAAVLTHQTLIGPMSPGDLQRVIELPAAQRGLALQPGLAQTMVEDLAGEPGALPLLSHALLETWERRQRLMLTVGGYQEAGGVRGAIAQTAERTLQSLPQADRATARSIFLSLTDVGEGAEPARRRVDRAELAAHSQSGGSLDRVLAILADARLVTIDERTVVVAHEALIRHWPRLRRWIDVERAGLLIHRRLTHAAGEWETLDRESAALYRGARLAAAREWASEHADHLSRLERDFLEASKTTEHSELEAAKRRTRRLRVLATGLAALTAMVAMLAVWALDQRSDARQQTAEATSLALTSAAAPLLSSRPDLSLLLATEAFRESPRVEARSSALAALTAASDPGVRAILHGSNDSVESVAFSPDGRTLVSASWDKAIRLWDARTRKPLGKPLTGHTEAIRTVAFSPDGRTLASGGVDKVIRLWDARTRQPLGPPLFGHTRAVFAVVFSPDGRTLASASADKTIRLWDVRTRKPLGAPLIGHTGLVLSVAFSPDGRTLASASGDLSGGSDDTIRLWDVRTRKPLGEPLTGHTKVVSSVAFSPDGRTLASASDDKTIRLWDARTRKPLGEPLTGHTGAVGTVAFSPDGRTLASAGEEETIRLWDARTRKQLGGPLAGHTGGVSTVAFSSDGRTVASASADKTIRLWDARSRTPLRPPLADDPTVALETVAFSPDGRTLASASYGYAIRLQGWDARARKQPGKPLTGHTSLIKSVAFSPDGRMLASASLDKTIRLWDALTGKSLGNPLTGHTGFISSVAFSPDGRRLASAGLDSTIRLWEVGTRKPLGKPLFKRAGALSSLSVAFSPDGDTLAFVSLDDTIRLWDVRSRKQLGKPLTGHTAAVTSVAFSPDGRALATASFDSTVRLWDARTHRALGAPLTGHTSGVQTVAFSPDGRTLASTSLDKTVRLWDVRARKPLGKPLTGHTGVVRSVAFSPDGRTLASAADDKAIRLWDKILWRNLAELQTQVCNLVGSGLSKTEWAQYASGIPYRQSCP